MEGGTSKLDQLREKKVEKSKEQISKVQEWVLNDRVADSVVFLTDRISQKEYLEQNEFQGWGNIENWTLQYPGGPLQWFAELVRGKILNIFDLLSICFMIQLFQRQMGVEEILKRYDEMMRQNPEKFELLVGKGNILYQNQQLLEAQTIYRLGLEMQPGCCRVNQYLSWISYQFGKIEQARILSSKCLEMDPKSASAQLVNIACGDEPKRELEDFIKRNKYFGRAYLMLGYMSDSKKKMRKYFESAVEIYSSSSLVRVTYAKKCCHLGLFAQAEQMSRFVLKMDPLCSFAYFVLGQIDDANDNSQQAKQYYSRGLQVGAYNFRIYESLATIYGEEGDSEMEVYYLETFMSVNPYNPQVNYRCAFVHQTLKNYPRAIELYEKIVETEDNKSIWLKLFQCYYDLKDFQNAEKWAIRCLTESRKEVVVQRRGLPSKFVSGMQQFDIDESQIDESESNSEQYFSEPYEHYSVVFGDRENYPFVLLVQFRSMNDKPKVDISAIMEFIAELHESKDVKEVKKYLVEASELVSRTYKGLYELMAVGEVFKKLEMREEGLKLFLSVLKDCESKQFHQAIKKKVQEFGG